MICNSVKPNELWRRPQKQPAKRPKNVKEAKGNRDETIVTLPIDVYLHVLSMLAPEDLLPISMVSKVFRRLLRNKVGLYKLSILAPVDELLQQSPHIGNDYRKAQENPSGTPAEAHDSQYMQTAKIFHPLVRDNPSLWEKLVERKYGRDLGRLAGLLYTSRNSDTKNGGNDVDDADDRNDCWKALPLDDHQNSNRDRERPASLFVDRTTLPNEMWKIEFQPNGDRESYYGCLIGGMMYDREKKLLSMFVDARGEKGMLDPMYSCLIWRPSAISRIGKYSISQKKFISFVKSPGHYKGVVVFDLSHLDRISIGNHPGPGGTGTFEFKYCHGFQPTHLFDVPPGQTIESILPTLRGYRGDDDDADCGGLCERYPFCDETEDDERNRWRIHAGDNIVERTHPTRWWVSE